MKKLKPRVVQQPSNDPAGCVLGEQQPVPSSITKLGEQQPPSCIPKSKRTPTVKQDRSRDPAEVIDVSDNVCTKVCHSTFILHKAAASLCVCVVL